MTKKKAKRPGAAAHAQTVEALKREIGELHRDLATEISRREQAQIEEIKLLQQLADEKGKTREGIVAARDAFSTARRVARKQLEKAEQIIMAMSEEKYLASLPAGHALSPATIEKLRDGEPGAVLWERTKNVQEP